MCFEVAGLIADVPPLTSFCSVALHILAWQHWIKDVFGLEQKKGSCVYAQVMLQGLLPRECDNQL